MKKKLSLIIILTILVAGILSISLRIQRVRGAGTIYVYIRENGQIDPITANITTLDNVTYTFNGTNYAFLEIERGNIVVEGSDYALEGMNWGTGLSWSHVSNITVKNLKISGFDAGVSVYNSSNNVFYGNEIIDNNHFGFSIYRSSNDTIYENTISSNGEGYSYAGHSSIDIAYCSNSTIKLNNITENYNLDGIYFLESSDCHIYENNITKNYFGIRLLSSSNNNGIYANTITASNLDGIYIHESSNNTLHANLLYDNRYGFFVYGYDLTEYFHNIDTTNTVNGKPVYYLINQHDESVTSLTYPEIGFMAFINSTNIEIEGLNLTGNSQGLLLAYTNNSIVTANKIISNYNGLVLFNSFENSLRRNTVTENEYRGIYLDYSNFNNVLENTIRDNDYQGIYVSDSENNTIYRNTIANHEYAIELYGTNNRFYLNNFVNNSQQIDSYDMINFWDNSLEGNYWSDYDSADLDHDGIGDIKYEIDSNNSDHRPLMGMFRSFNTSVGEHVNVISNSTIEDFQYFQDNSTIKMYASNMTSNQTYGFCRVMIPHTLMNVTNIEVIIDNETTPLLHHNYTLHENSTHGWIYFAYPHSKREIDIIPELSSFTILPLFIVATLLVVMVHRRKYFC